MSLASRVHERIRSRLKRLVEKERQMCGCAKAAISRIARKVHMSPASIYRLVNGYGEVQVKAVSQVALIMVSLGTSKVAARFCRTAKRSEAGLHA